MDNVYVYNIRYVCVCVCVYIYYGSIKYLMRLEERQCKELEGAFFNRLIKQGKVERTCFPKPKAEERQQPKRVAR